MPKPIANYDDCQFFSLADSDQARWRSYSRRIVRYIQRNFGSSGRLLDVGCSHGLLIEEASKVGFDAEGVEPSRTGVAYCLTRGLNVQHGYLVEGVFPLNSFDVVVMAHVIEHVADPLQLLRVARGILKPRGVLCLSQTNYQGTLPRWLGRRWGYWVEDIHYYHFSQQGITYVLQKAGFKTPTIRLSPLGRRLNLTIKNPRMIAGLVLNAFEYAVSQLRIFLPLQGDQMYVLVQPAK